MTQRLIGMTEILKTNIFFFITAIAAIMVVLLLSVALVFVIRILRDVKKISHRAEEESEEIVEDIEDVRKELRIEARIVRRFLHILSAPFKNRLSKKKE